MPRSSTQWRRLRRKAVLIDRAIRLERSQRRSPDALEIGAGKACVGTGDAGAGRFMSRLRVDAPAIVQGFDGFASSYSTVRSGIGK